jgi:hypothetical protein
MSTEDLRPDEDLQNAQETLGGAIDKARGGEDLELSGQIRDAGERYVRQLFGALRMTRLHDLDNAAFDKPIAILLATIAELIELLGAVHLITVESQVYINDLRVRLDERSDMGNLFGRELRRQGLGGISVHDQPSEEELRSFIELFAAEPHPDAPRAAFRDGLTKRGVDCVEVVGVFRFRITGEKGGDSIVEMTEVTSRASNLVDVTVDALGGSRMPNPLPIRRVVTEMLAAGEVGEGLLEDAEGGSRFSAHTLRVSMIALLIGRALEMNEEALQDLGVCAMFHDVGYAYREGAQPAKSGVPAVQGYPPPKERHASAGARMVLRQRGFHESKILRALTTLEHERDYDSSHGRPCLFARILCIAEAYDTLLRKDGGGCTPTRALGKIVAHSGTYYDPDLVQLLVNSLGRYPPGTMLELADGRIVQVKSTARTPESWDLPLCKVLHDPNDYLPEDTEVLCDLADGGEITGEFEI